MNGAPLTLERVLSERVAVWGLGAEGLAFAGLALAAGVEPVLIDDTPDAAAERAAAALGGDRPVQLPTAVDWASVDVVVRSPGVSRYRPELAAAESAGVTVTTAMAVWLEDHAASPVIAVTGTKGKSTTAALAAAILEAGGRRAELIGNIGVPVLDTYGSEPPDAYVVEVSSYQAADVVRSPGVVVLTGLAPDHLDWHGGVERYYRDKLRLIDAGPPGRLAVNAASPEALARTAAHPDRILFGPEGRVSVDAGGWVVADGHRLVQAGRLRVVGRHNIWNLCGAVAGVVLLTGEVPTAAAVTATVDGFAGLPSRCHIIGIRHGRTYVDDALASNPSATAASVEAFDGVPLTVIVGGADRGVDPAPLVGALAAHRRIVAVIVVPPEPQRLAAALAGWVADVRTAGGLAEAVELAAALSPEEDGVILFSPGAPTPEGGGGYRARSAAFARAAGLPEE